MLLHPWEKFLEDYYEWQLNEYGSMPLLHHDPGNDHGMANHLVSSHYKGMPGMPPTRRRRAKFLQICRENGMDETNIYFPEWN
jgi:hypothetical protein